MKDNNNKPNKRLSIGCWERSSKNNRVYFQGYAGQSEARALLELLQKVANGETLSFKIWESNSRSPNAPTFNLVIDSFAPKQNWNSDLQKELDLKNKK